MRRTRVKILLALGTAIAVTAVLRVGGPSEHIGRRAFPGLDRLCDSRHAQGGRTVSSPAKMHGYATLVRILRSAP